jgi:hypothetical protein
MSTGFASDQMLLQFCKVAGGTHNTVEKEGYMSVDHCLVQCCSNTGTGSLADGVVNPSDAHESTAVPMLLEAAQGRQRYKPLRGTPAIAKAIEEMSQAVTYDA